MVGKDPFDFCLCVGVGARGAQCKTAGSLGCGEPVGSDSSDLWGRMDASGRRAMDEEGDGSANSWEADARVLVVMVPFTSNKTLESLNTRNT